MLNGLDLTVLVAALALGFAVFVFFWDRTIARKEFTYDFSATKLKEFNRTFEGDLELNFRGDPVFELSLVTLTLRNSGRVPITKNDMEGDFMIAFKAKQALLADLSACIPDDLVVSFGLDQEGENLFIAKLLLNAGDSMTFSILATEFKRLEVIGRIVGVKKIIRKRLKSTDRRFDGSSIGLYFAIAGVVVMLTAHYADQTPHWNGWPLIWNGCFVIAGLISGGPRLYYIARESAGR